MNYLKIQNELLKLAYKKDKLRDFNYKIEPDTVIILNRYYIVRVPADEWFLDTEKLFKDKMAITLDVNKVTENATEVRLTNELISEDKTVLRKFINKDGQGIYVDDKLLKIFTSDKYDHLCYEGSTPKDPVIIRNELGDYLGAILPVYRKES